MKKILFVLAIMFTMALSANAQFYAGGSLGLHNSKNDFSLSVFPEIGYTFQNNTGVGCVFDFSYINDTIGTIGFGVNPYFEYDFLTIDKFIFYVHTYLHYNTAWQAGNTVEHNYGVSLRPGVIWSVAGHWSAAFYAGGVEYMWKQSAGTAFKDGTGDFNLGLSTNVPCGVALYYSF